MKATAIAPSNIAFIKYWGKKDKILRLPTNGSLSMNLSALLTTTTVEFSDKYKENLVIINGQKATVEAEDRVVDHLDRIRKLGNISYRAKVASVNNFPTSSGLSSSASGFAALTLAAAISSGLKLTEKELSILARKASGSACRSIPDGFVEWFEGTTDASSWARSIYPPSFWDIKDIVVIVDRKEKDVSTTEGQKNAFSSPFFKLRLLRINDKIAKLKKFLKEKDFENFGKLVEDEALELHAMIMTAKPSLIYWLPETVRLMRLVRVWRSRGVSVYFTINTGHDIHLLCEEKNRQKVLARLEDAGIKKDNIIVSSPAEGVKLINNHLF